MLAQGSWRFVLPPIILALPLFFFSPLSQLVGALLLGIGVYMAWFFRDPKRDVIPDETILFAAADGTVKEITFDVDVKVAIRMSPFDVHLNRAPIGGNVTKIEHSPGKHRTVYFAGAEEKNEQNLIIFDHPDFEIEILQITGAFARRIECWVVENQVVQQGDKIGMIRFGSQTNMLIRPKKGASISLSAEVSIDQQVHAGLTPILKVRSSSHE